MKKKKCGLKSIYWLFVSNYSHGHIFFSSSIVLIVIRLVFYILKFGNNINILFKEYKVYQKYIFYRMHPSMVKFFNKKIDFVIIFYSFLKLKEYMYFFNLINDN